MDQSTNFQRKADEARELFFRMFRAFPKEQKNALELKNRHAAGDRNVMETTEADGRCTYSLVFTDEQKEELEKAFLSMLPELPKDNLYAERLDDREWAARKFVGVMEDWADANARMDSLTPEIHKKRVQTLKSINNAMLNFEQLVSSLDSNALAFWYAHMVDRLAHVGLQLSPADNAMKSMLDHQLRATVEAGELRQDLRGIIAIISQATIQAADTLPKHQYTETDPKLTTVTQLEQLIIDNQIPFDTSETGFSAKCLRAIFDLSGLEVEKVSYWLKKAKDNPDSHARFRQNMATRMNGTE